jgi:hypothetical protein
LYWGLTFRNIYADDLAITHSNSNRVDFFWFVFHELANILSAYTNRSPVSAWHVQDFSVHRYDTSPSLVWYSAVLDANTGWEQ